MDNIALNLKYKDAFYRNKTVENLEKYVLSEVYIPIADFPNAVKIIQEEKLSLSSTKLMMLESFFCFTQVYSESKMLPVLERSLSTMNDEEKALFYYLKALSFQSVKEASERVIKEALDKSISYKVPFVSNYLALAEVEKNENKKNNANSFFSGDFIR